MPRETVRVLTFIECALVLLNLFVVTRNAAPFMFGISFDAVALPVTAAIMAALSVTRSKPDQGVFVGLMIIALGLMRFGEASGSALYVVATFGACGFIFYRFTQSSSFGFTKKE